MPWIALLVIVGWWRNRHNRGQQRKIAPPQIILNDEGHELEALKRRLDGLKTEYKARCLLIVLPAALIMSGIMFPLSIRQGQFSLQTGRHLLLGQGGLDPTAVVAVNIAVTGVIATLAVALAVSNRSATVQPHGVFWASATTTINSMLATLSLVLAGLILWRALLTDSWPEPILGVTFGCLNTALAAVTVAWEGKDLVQILDRQRNLQHARRVAAKYSRAIQGRATQWRSALILVSFFGVLQSLLLWTVVGNVDGSWLGIGLKLTGTALVCGALIGFHLAGLMFAIRVELDPDWATRAGIMALFLCAETTLLLSGLQLLPLSNAEDLAGVMGIGFQGLLPPILVGLGLIRRWPRFIALVQLKRARALEQRLEREIEQLGAQARSQADPSAALNGGHRTRSAAQRG